MRFGPVPLEAAVGAVLAHAQKLPGGTLKKGRLLSAADVEALRAAGLADVIAARFDPDDLDEDAAASRIAAAVTGAGLTASAAYTGRVNLYAAADGLAVIDAPVVDAINLVHESITFATLPPFTPVTAGRMVATVKIIPFAAPAGAVAAVESLVRDSPPIRLASYRPHAAGLVQTLLPGTKPSVLDRTTAVTVERLEALGGRLAAERRVEHAAAAVGDAIRDLLAQGCTPILLVGASAITDRRDVLPAAVGMAGGEVLHFGMPVDPGNLLLLARVGETPVLGLPGCARSPKLNGFDWVLQRLAADIPVTPDAVMRMGVGGLLAEIPSRPLPRERATSLPRAPRIAALVLAAGLSRRMGRVKLLEPLEGRALVTHAVAAACASQAEPVLLVTGHAAEAVAATVRDRPVRIVHATDHAAGLSASLKAGLAALPAEADGVMVMLGDMPRIRPATLDRLIAAFAPAEGRAICVPVHQGQRGNPVLWDRRFAPEMMALSGDSGAKSLLALHADAVCEVPVDDPGILLDIDTPESLAALTAAPAGSAAAAESDPGSAAAGHPLDAPASPES